MNLDELTLGQIKKLSTLINDGSTNKSNLYERYIGKYVICRSINEGVNAGKVISADETGVILEDARRLYYHKPINKNVSWYEGVAKYGISKDSRLGTAIEKIIVENYSLTICSMEAEESIRGAKDNEQN